MNPAERERKLMEAKTLLFEHFTLEDQRSYYKRTIKKYRQAASQVNLLRALFALLTIIVTAIAAYIVQTRFSSGTVNGCEVNAAALKDPCFTLRSLVNCLLLLSILFPALGAFFNMLADLYQWDRLIKIYDEAAKGLETPDALSPDPHMDDVEYRASLLALAAGTLKVMRDETGQWGQLIRPPENIDQFREKAVAFYEQMEREKLGREEESGGNEGDNQEKPV